MERASPIATARPLRADAKRNREAIVAAALEVFERDGVNTSLDRIATVAGVGNATLYRNFPTRDDLLFEVLRDGIAHLESRASERESTQPPGPVLHEWLHELTWHLRIWHDLPAGVVDALNDAVSPLTMACAPLIARTTRLVQAAQREGVVPACIDPDAVFEMVTLVSWGMDRFHDTPARARSRVAMAFAALFPTGAPAGDPSNG